jgi:hypothetical protein
MAALFYSTILVTNPLSTVILSWLGTPDSLSLLLIVPFIFTRSVLWIAFLTALGVMNHVVLIIAACEILFLRWVSRDNINSHHLLGAVLGGLVGILIVRWFLAVYHIEITVSRLDFIFLRDFTDWFLMNAKNFPLSFFSLFNIQWIIIPVCLVMFFRSNRSFYISVLMILLVNYGITFFMEDTTRIFTLLSWGVLMVCIIQSNELAQAKKTTEGAYLKQFQIILMVIGLASFITPR